MVPKMSSVILPDDGLAPEPALPAQFYDLWHRSRAIAPERALALAVLEQAVLDLQKYRFAKRRRQQRLYMEAYDWVRSDDRSWPFAFANLCDLLGFHLETLRHELLERVGLDPERPSIRLPEVQDAA